MRNNSHWERKLNISTAPASYEKEDNHHSRYEPTDYAVLERLARSGWISRDDTLVDYGCGKGRVGFFMNHALGCKTIGVEYDPALYEDALENLRSYTGKSAADRVGFLCESAENCLPAGANRFYFFNPFSAKILQAVIRRILGSFYDDPREMVLFFYYVLDPYLDILMGEAGLEFAGEIDCRDLFHNEDLREKILVFKVTGGM